MNIPVDDNELNTIVVFAVSALLLKVSRRLAIEWSNHNVNIALRESEWLCCI